MTEGFASDIINDDTVMESPEATLSIDLSQLDPQMALRVAKIAGLDDQEPWVIGEWEKGETVNAANVRDAEFHLPIEAALTALEELQIVPQHDMEDSNE